MANARKDDDAVDRYLAYWDDIVKKWFAAREKALTGKRIRDISDIDDPFDPGKRKIRDELRAVIHRELDKVDPFLKTLKDKIEIDPLLMPEPYWGDPSPGKHSFVIADYNPGGSMEDKPKQRDWKNSPHRNSLRKFENRVKTSGYKAFAKFAPIMMSEDALEAKRWSDFKDYGGRKWWMERRSWAERVAGDSGILPFGMEFCGWHSKNWPSDKAKCLSEVPEFDELVLKPFLEAVETSTCKLGFCVGAKWSKTLKDRKYGFRQISDPVVLLTTNEGRRHQLFRNANGCRVLVTWARHAYGFPPPGPDFASEEIKLLNGRIPIEWQNVDQAETGDSVKKERLHPVLEGLKTVVRAAFPVRHRGAADNVLVLCAGAGWLLSVSVSPRESLKMEVHPDGRTEIPSAIQGAVGSWGPPTGFRRTTFGPAKIVFAVPEEAKRNGFSLLTDAAARLRDLLRGVEARTHVG